MLQAEVLWLTVTDKNAIVHVLYKMFSPHARSLCDAKMSSVSPVTFRNLLLSGSSKCTKTSSKATELRFRLYPDNYN